MTPAVFGHGHLRLYLLSLLDEQPRHGYELIQALEQRFGGTYVPSAGTIYPRLAKLVEDGLITKREDGRRSVYDITDAGREELRARAGELDGIESELSDSVRRLADEVRSSVNAAMRTLRADLAANAREARDESRSAGASGRTENVSVRVESRSRLQEAEAALAEFRAELRSDLRRAVVEGELTAETVRELRGGLDELRHRVRESLTTPRG
ncbi:PadR family transcriptional regulator [Lysobacter korlensis]|uniref:PadR family transcriptional regulator n=1 Tax=Lysobacter korlensis TaxID=553636 RepID=A0ABV6RU27_9GAMM